MKARDKRRAWLAATSLALIINVVLSTVPTFAATKVPVLDIAKSALLNIPADIMAVERAQENWAAIDGDSRLLLINQKGEEIWNISPLNLTQAGDGAITALHVDSAGIVIAGVSQNPLQLPTPVAPEVSPTPTPSATSSATPTISITPSPSPTTQTVPLVNPDNVSEITEIPFRKGLANIFFARFDNQGNILKVANTENMSNLLPTAIATRGPRAFVVGNEYLSEKGARGALYILDDDLFTSNYSYGESGTTFTSVVASPSKSITVVGSSSETIADRKVVGSADGIILTISQTTGKISKILRSSGVKAQRSWDFAQGNLLLSGRSQTKSVREGVVTSFSSKGVVRWTVRYQRSDRAIATNNCVAVSLLGASPGLTFKATGREIFLYTIDSKGKFQRGVRLPKQELIALTTTSAKGCAVFTKSRGSGIRLSLL